MQKRTLLIMVAAAAVTVIVMALTSTGNDVVLPGPHPVSYADAQAATAARSAASRSNAKTTTSTTAPRGTQPPSPGSGQQVVTIAPPVVLSGCTVSVSNPRPPQGHTQQTVTVTAVAGAEVRIVGSYPRATSVHSEVADSTGTAVFNLSIASSPVGVTVGVSATASYRNQKVTCQTSFTPVA
jgi:hypothetical protein